MRNYATYILPFDMLLEYATLVADESGLDEREIGIPLHIEYDMHGIVEVAIRCVEGNGDRGPNKEWLGLPNTAYIRLKENAQ